jgi:hypothetical protein
MHTPTSIAPVHVSNAPIAVSEPVPEPAEAKSTGRKRSITVARAQRAAEDAGWIVINANALKASSVVGAFIGQCGAMEIGRGRLVVEASRRDEVDQLLVDATASCTDPEQKLGILRLRVELIARGTEIGRQLIASEPKASPSQPTMGQLPGFGPQVVVAVNGANSVSATTRQDEAPRHLLAAEGP